MKLQEGVHLHFIPTEKFTTNSIKIRFAAPMKEETVAGRVLVANILEMANADYPRTIDFRRKLAHLYAKLHEDPSVPNFGTPGRGVRLLPGMVIAIEPMINEGTAAIKQMPDGWTVKTKDGKLSAHFEHTVAITANGPLILTQA